MKTVYLIYSVPDLDSCNCDKRIERALELREIFPLFMSEADRILAHALPDEFGAESEYLEVWTDGVRTDVIYPLASEVSSC